MKYTKPPLSTSDLYNLLIKRWLIILENEEKDIKRDLENIWYFRLTWYFKYFQKDDNTFLPNINFHKVLNHYIFDRKLRLLTFDAIEKIEISVKSNINNYMSLKYWIHWYLDKSLFNLISENNQNNYTKLVNKINDINNKQISIFVKEYFKKYTFEKYLPSWMLMEELTIWEISTIYYLLEFEHKEFIAKCYDTYAKDFWTWLSLLNTLRNISAHHARLWNRIYITKLKATDVKFKKYFQKMSNQIEVKPNYYNSLLVISYLLNKINKNFWWLDDLDNLIKKYEATIDIKKMWFTPIWKKEIESIIN